MRKRISIVIATVVGVVALALGGATLALGGGNGLIFDDGHFAKPGSLDDGQNLQSQTNNGLAAAVAAAQRARSGQLGQVDLERAADGIVYSVDVGDQEVRVDADNGSIVSVTPQD